MYTTCFSHLVTAHETRETKKKKLYIELMEDSFWFL